AVFSAVLRIGLSGFLVVCLYALAVFALLGTAWWVLVAGSGPKGWRSFIWARVVRDSAAETLPFSQIGGFVIGARAAVLDGIPVNTSAASMVADVTTELLAQVIYACIGVSFLAIQLRRSEAVPSTGWLAIGILAAAIIATCFFLVQYFGGARIRSLVTRFLPQALSHTDAVTSSLEVIYRAHGRIAASLVLHLLSWIASGAGTWIAFRLMGAQVSLTGVIAVDSLVYAVRSIGFAVPNALGVQEAAYAVFAPLLGIGPEIGLAISLIKRGRDIAIGIPVLLFWQVLEGHRAVAAARSES
ncbi:MAG TPA: lysylphosphatidylglycerol synthase domain-containing protein, partial [Micropepsaceae bacterium]|nr:lysylphosphatidylglycerol synthase domain-containing protein [Micropepsaceae bacterium]